jgi:hypothetical protein
METYAKIKKQLERGRGREEGGGGEGGGGGIPHKLCSRAFPKT